MQAQQQRDLAGRLREQLADSDREALRWREHAERAVADLQSTQVGHLTEPVPYLQDPYKATQLRTLRVSRCRYVVVS